MRRRRHRRWTTAEALFGLGELHSRMQLRLTRKYDANVRNALLVPTTWARQNRPHATRQTHDANEQKFRPRVLGGGAELEENERAPRSRQCHRARRRGDCDEKCASEEHASSASGQFAVIQQIEPWSIAGSRPSSTSGATVPPGKEHDRSENVPAARNGRFGRDRW